MPNSAITLDTLTCASLLPNTREVDAAERERRLFKAFPGFTWSERPRDLPGWFWDFGYDVQHLEKRLWVCKQCVYLGCKRPTARASKGTQNIVNHLFTEHGVSAPVGKGQGTAEKKHHAKNYQAQVQPKQRSITQLLGLDTMTERDQQIANKLVRSFDKQHFQRLVVQWLVDANKPFTEAEDPNLRAVFDYLNPSVAKRKAHLVDTSVRRLIDQQYTKHKGEVIATLKRAPGKIHISFDGWTSRTRQPLYGIACFFRNESNKPQKVIISVPELAERHTGENIASVVVQIISEFELNDKIGYFALDNASNNDTAMDYIGESLGFDGRKRRGRCLGHVLNISARALLFGNHADALEDDPTGAHIISDTEWERWQSKGPVGKLHNFVYDIFRSQRLALWLKQLQLEDTQAGKLNAPKAKKPLKVVRDNDTRWLSQLYMIRRALRLKPYLRFLVAKYKQEWEEENTNRNGMLKKSAKRPRILEDGAELTTNDWIALERLGEILGHYEDVVLTLEGDGQIRRRRHGFTGSYGNVWDTILGYEQLLTMLEDQKQQAEDFPDPEQFRIGINLAWDKLNHYYSKLDETPIYYIALALHPGYGWAWFEDQWEARPGWVAHAKAIVRGVWETEYQSKPIPECQDTPQATTTGLKRNWPNPFDKQARKRRVVEVQHRAQAMRIPGDEYHYWLANESEREDCLDPIAYWHGMRDKYPRLSQMALDFLTIPPMSAEVERLFSSTGRMVTAQRTSLDAITVSVCQALRSWYRSGIIRDLDPVLMAYDDKERIDKVSSIVDDEERAKQAVGWAWSGDDVVSDKVSDEASDNEII
ncbi:reverse transcriptase [Apiospora kogelbergensis]|uniref:Reverse transcriptase n=1 Tax=Apiospora kogelbergensis TaxID=1337665 RepID=A0AAW0QLZ7_9PEZI